MFDCICGLFRNIRKTLNTCRTKQPWVIASLEGSQVILVQKKRWFHAISEFFKTPVLCYVWRIRFGRFSVCYGVGPCVACNEFSWHVRIQHLQHHDEIKNRVGIQKQKHKNDEQSLASPNFLSKKASHSSVFKASSSPSCVNHLLESCQQHSEGSAFESCLRSAMATLKKSND